MPEITMPQLGETVTEGTITKWLKNVGDHIEEDEVIYEVSTDKVDSEVPSPVSGYLTEIRVQEGETVDVGAVLAVVSDEPGAAGAAPSTSETAAPAETASPADTTPTAAPSDQSPQPAPVTEAPAAPTATDEEEKDAAEPAAATPPAAASEPEPSSEPAPSPAPPPGAGEPSGDGMSRVLSPVVRRLISEHNLDPESIPGSGAGGRITRADVLSVIDRGAQQPAPVPAAAPTAPAAPTPAAASASPEAAPARPAPVPATGAGERDEAITFSNIRRRTAEHMRRSIDTSAHTLVVIEVDYQNVDKVRTVEKDRFRADEGFGLTYLPFIARAAIDAIREFPHVNASVGDNELIVHHYVNLGIAVDMDFHGLIVPVIHEADGKRLRAIAREMVDLAGRARSKRLSADEIAGGTFTITNAGPFGTLITAPVINQPQVAILATDGIKPKPVALPLGDGSYGVVVHPVGNLCLSFDHRAYDGAYASAFVARIREIIETRDWSQEL